MAEFTSRLGREIAANFQAPFSPPSSHGHNDTTALSGFSLDEDTPQRTTGHDNHINTSVLGQAFADWKVSAADLRHTLLHEAEDKENSNVKQQQAKAKRSSRSKRKSSPPVDYTSRSFVLPQLNYVDDFLAGSLKGLPSDLSDKENIKSNLPLGDFESVNTPEANKINYNSLQALRAQIQTLKDHDQGVSDKVRLLEAQMQELKDRYPLFDDPRFQMMHQSFLDAVASKDLAQANFQTSESNVKVLQTRLQHIHTDLEKIVQERDGAMDKLKGHESLVTDIMKERDDLLEQVRAAKQTKASLQAEMASHEVRVARITEELQQGRVRAYSRRFEMMHEESLSAKQQGYNLSKSVGLSPQVVAHPSRVLVPDQTIRPSESLESATSKLMDSLRKEENDLAFELAKKQSAYNECDPRKNKRVWKELAEEIKDLQFRRDLKREQIYTMEDIHGHMLH
ncbi:hypothetical protein F5Y18DRAFT_378105 [Xylariaceae sp. FL1019]|nr:hypothetical protein F5Y18DRAFT_378105 [Xylariaceae sp. FL1019]